MTLTITVRYRALPAARPAPAAGSLLPLAEPAALLIAEAAGLGLIGQVLLATALRSAQHALAGQPAALAS